MFHFLHLIHKNLGINAENKLRVTVKIFPRTSSFVRDSNELFCSQIVLFIQFYSVIKFIYFIFDWIITTYPFRVGVANGPDVPYIRVANGPDGPLGPTQSSMIFFLKVVVTVCWGFFYNFFAQNIVVGDSCKFCPPTVKIAIGEGVCNFLTNNIFLPPINNPSSLSFLFFTQKSSFSQNSSHS